MTTKNELAAILANRPSPEAFMASAPSPPGSNTAWGSQYGLALRKVVIEHAAHAPRTLQKALGPSEIGSPCDRNVVAKLTSMPRTNHIMDPWPAIVGTAIHSWLAEAFEADNERSNYVRWLAEFRVHPHPDHPGTGDLYDFFEEAVVDHKGIYVDTPIATPDGWTTVGKLSVGDRVFGSDGKPCRVTKTYPIQNDRPCYKVTFDDGASLITDDIQLWQIDKGTRRTDKGTARLRHSTVMSTDDARQQVFTKTRQPRRQLRIVNASPLQLPDISLPVHPYVLGTWLGDGQSDCGKINTPDDNIFDHIRSCGYVIGPPDLRGLRRTIYGLSGELRTAGLLWPYSGPLTRSHGRLAGHKLIPTEYLRAGYHQRLSLLQGLMDSDGHWNKATKRAVFTNTDKQLAYDTAALVASLGWKARVYPRDRLPSGRGATAATSYEVVFTPHEANPFRLRRKANQVRMQGSQKSTYRIIKSIELTISVPTRCIDVDSDDHLYLAGAEMIPTHNCLGTTTLDDLRKDGPPIWYHIQLLAYARGFRLMGLPVKRIVLAAWPRTKSRLDTMYVWEHLLEPADDVLLDETFERMEYRKMLAQLVLDGKLTYKDIPPTPGDKHCIYCPILRVDVLRDPTAFGCAGHHLIKGRGGNS